MLASALPRRALVLVACMVAGLGLSAGQASAADYSAAQVRNFQYLSGQPQWAQPSLDRLARSQWRFAPSGEFLMWQPDSNPLLRGRWTRNGSVVQFAGRYVFNTGYSGSTVVDVTGTANLQGRPVLRLRFMAAQTLAAVVGCDMYGRGCSRYGNSRTKIFTAQVLLRRFA